MLQSNLYPTADLRAADARHYLHPFTDHKALAEEGARVIVKGDGVWLWDSEGNKLLDGMSGLWCTNVGHGRPEIADAVHAQMGELAFYNSFFKTTNAPAVRLAERLAAIAPAHINKVFFTSSGSEANDTVLRMVRHYWALKGQPNRQIVIARHNAYHGSTMAGASLGGMKPMHAQGGLPIPGIVHIRQPYWFGEGHGMAHDAFGLQAAADLERMIRTLGPENVAAFIGEPIQGAGGVIIPPATYWPEIQRICRKYDILLVADEVICGFGRTGRWFGSDYFGIEPDLMTIAKGVTSGYLPLGGVMVSDKVADVLVNLGEEFYHGYTYSGHPTCAAAALANLDIIQREGLVERVANDIGPYLQGRWKTLADHPIVGETRMVGLIGALELVPDPKNISNRFTPTGAVGSIARDYAFQTGLVMRAVRDSLIIAPPLTLTHAEADELVRLARQTLDLTYEELKRRGVFG
ncbi:aspartate aminotransferase family protein [Prosthecomicrobium hirschii]|uniref:aspartate aminotransferase family protein n=1 Tax=Prosthecodimorpha hirschii TaxID=665126 RepID=UPI002220A906|nr:aspartate aminotransferase family protein [Prosthecomicrobium hirschii]MCW1843817.1 aspartate aminotransferase family protein [Prosthecomicrobium hirschii]